MVLARRHIAPLAATGAVLAMLGLVAVSMPLYRAFCNATGYEGTPRIGAQAAGNAKGQRTMVVRFDSNVGAGLPWRFEPEQASVSVRTGQTATVFYKVTNDSDAAVTARAVYNVGPPSMGPYFDKVACFCFTDQTLQPHQTLEMPVVFFLDPALEKDETMAGAEEVVLSYTFYRQKTPADAKSAANEAGRKL